MAKKSFTSMKALEDAIRKEVREIVNSALRVEVADTAKTIVQEHIASDVYGVYNPKIISHNKA